MSPDAPQTLSLTVERQIPHPPEKVWRALTQPELIAAWLMKNDFAPVPGHRFGLHGDWGSVACQVLAIEPPTALSYSWEAMGLVTVVSWTLQPAGSGTRLRMVQSGFRPDQQQAYHGASFGWDKLFTALEQLLDQPG